MPLLTEILSPDLPQHDLIAAHPDWTRADFNRAVFALSGSLKTAGIQSAALWFDDAALFACAVLASWHAGARVLLLPNTARENIGWGETADIFLTDNLVHQQAWQLPECLAQAQRQPENGRQPENWSVPADAEAHLKTSGSSGKAQIIIKTAAQMQAEAQTLAAALPFGRNGEAVIGSVSPQHLYGFTFRFALALTMGWTMERAQAVYPENLLAATAAHRQAVWIASPAVLNRLGEGRDPRVLQKVAGIVWA